MKDTTRDEVTTQPIPSARFLEPTIHDNGPVRKLTAGSDEDIDEDSVERCIDGAYRLIPRD